MKKIFEDSGTADDHRVGEVFRGHYDRLVRKADRMFGVLLLFEWLLGILFALVISPRTWAGNVSETHIHVYAAIFLGGAIAGYPAFLVFTSPGARLNRYVVAISQTLFSVLFIHLTGGRIETHFHVFGSLAFLALYRDWRVIVIATVITALDHLLRGIFWPASVYGVLSATPWRALEHSAWVIFEDVVLLFSIRVGLQELWSISEKQVGLERALGSVETQVVERTRELQLSQQVVVGQQQALLAAAKMSALGEMAGGVAHEINNPLATIRILASQAEEILLENGEVDRSMLAERVAKVVRTTDRIAKIVQGLRSFSRDGSSDPFESVGAKRLLEETLALCQEKFRNNGVEVAVEAVDPGLVFEGRFTQLSQVVLNLLSNAYDSIVGMKEPWIRVGAKDLGWGVEIQVTDGGPGISPDVQAKLFQPFFTTKAIGKGTGLGLSVSLGIVRSHGGELSLDPGRPNTSFVIRLPKIQAAGSVPASSAPSRIARDSA